METGSENKKVPTSFNNKGKRHDSAGEEVDTHHKLSAIETFFHQSRITKEEPSLVETTSQLFSRLCDLPAPIVLLP